MKLIKNWKQAGKMASVRLLSFLTVTALIWEQLEQTMQEKLLEFVPDVVEPYMLPAFAMLVIYSRLVDQGIAAPSPEVIIEDPVFEEAEP